LERGGRPEFAPAESEVAARSVIARIFALTLPSPTSRERVIWNP
jgi:hypothetical protein